MSSSISHEEETPMSPKTAKSKTRPMLPQVLCGLLLSFTLFVFAPIEMYILNSANFWFQFKDFVPVFLALFAAAFIVVEAVYLLFRKLPYAVYLMLLALLFGCTLCLYLQGNYLCMSNEVLFAEDPVWQDLLIPMLGNLLIWAAVILGSMAFILIKPKVFTKIISALCALVLVMESSALAVLLMTNTQDKESTNIYCSEAEQHTYSQNGDVLVFMVDTWDVRLFNRMLEEEPEYTETFRDFTYYRNASSSYPFSDPSFASFMTGINCYNEEPFYPYTRRAFRSSQFFPELIQNGLTVQVFGAPTGIFSSEQLPQVANLRYRESSVLSYSSFINTMMRMVGYRYAPQAIQPFLLKDYIAAFAECQYYPNDAESEALVDDFRYIQRFRELGVTVDNSRRFFKYQGLLGAHNPRTMNRYGEKVPYNSVDRYEQSLGCTLLLREVFESLKEKGVYDPATIIVMADHGINNDERNGICSPALLVKYPHESGFDQMRISDAPVELLDMRATALFGAGLDHEAFGSPVQAWEGIENRERYLMTFAYSEPSGYDFWLGDLTEHAVPADASDLNSYIPTGRVFQKK